MISLRDADGVHDTLDAERNLEKKQASSIAELSFSQLFSFSIGYPLGNSLMAASVSVEQLI